MAPEAWSKRLDETFREIARNERALAKSGDRRTLARYGDPANGAAIAALLGYERLSEQEARTVDQLFYLPHSASLIREYLQRTGAARTGAVKALAEPQASPPRRSSVERASAPS